ncbi:MAG: lysophospholipid acyltransferase family protein [Bacilli bacterium]|nr:lysophospholipid acyltransferase family protein [Bacilli bacterium]
MKVNINLKKFLTETVYRLIKIPAKPCILAKYKPIILNKGTLPKDEAIVFAPNHRQTNDAFLMFSTINVPVHWMALKRFFTGEDSIFNNSKNPILCKITALVFNGIGAVPIIRDQDKHKYPNETNSASLKTFDDYLKTNSNIGIFPEGTINLKPEEQKLLEPKTSAFWFAKDNNAYVLPIAITWIPKNLNLPERAIINYRPPFKKGEMNVREMRNYWIKTVTEGLEENSCVINNLINERQSFEDAAKVKKLTPMLRK